MNSLQNIPEHQRTKYRSLVERIDVSSERKDEMIAIVYRMMQAFVNAAFGEDPIQNILQNRIKDSFQDAALDVKTIANEAIDQRRGNSVEIDDSKIGGENKIKNSTQESSP